MKRKNCETTWEIEAVMIFKNVGRGVADFRISNFGVGENGSNISKHSKELLEGTTTKRRFPEANTGAAHLVHPE